MKRSFWLAAVAVLSISVLQACSAPERLVAVPQDLTTRAEIPGIRNARFWPSDPASMQHMTDVAYAAVQAEEAAGAVVDADGNLPPVSFLAVSGGGDDGAFGAGLLVGWTAHGTRPEFKLVTGVSTGALTAPFAFLGPDYDDELRAVYTGISAADIYEERGILAALFDDALSDTTPLQATVAKHFTEELMHAIAEAYGKGRILLIASTDLDSRRPVIWDLGAIASSGSPDALNLIRKILVASAAIPGAFPPVMIDVVAGGRSYQEMHVDGGAVSQAFIYPPQLNVAALSEEYGISRERTAYIIRNARLDPDWASTERQTMSIAGRAIATLIQSQGIGDLYRMYLETGRDGVDYNLAFIGPEFDTPGGGDFDPVYMGALFEYGYALGSAGYPWHKNPPGFAADE
ncbi:MAG: patatin-like phospholipase family protein [Dongiaceae bacterium]